MSTYTQRFLPVKFTAHRKVICPGCGKRRSIQRTFQQTVNPWHPAVKALPPDADYHTAYNAVWDSVREQAADWEPTDYEARHGACVEGAS